VEVVLPFVLGSIYQKGRGFATSQEGSFRSNDAFSHSTVVTSECLQYQCLILLVLMSDP